MKRIAFVCALSALGVCAARPAHAESWRTYSAMFCLNESISGYTQYSETLYAENKGQFVDELSDEYVETYWCPTFNDSTFDVTGASMSVSVQGYSNGYLPYTGDNAVALQACRTYYIGGGNGGVCGAATTENTAGNYSADIADLTAWSGATDNDTYFVVWTPSEPTSGGTTNDLFSYAIFN